MLHNCDFTKIPMNNNAEASLPHQLPSLLLSPATITSTLLLLNNMTNEVFIQLKIKFQLVIEKKPPAQVLIWLQLTGTAFNISNKTLTLNVCTQRAL